ncbi:LPS assembly lipoprotein LptE [Rhodanobacter caeni]|uniref:LPS-assembly lipoprotein LptE n=1 Tax=Rhodanobacter caeni TaxID=657654 RepID=A0ABN0UPP6_9GAMM
MNITRPGRAFRPLLMLLLATVITACGFHLRQTAALPASMQRVHLDMRGGDFQRSLTRALQHSGVTVEDESGPGIAELRVPVASFSTDQVSAGGYVRITEYAIRYEVRFDMVDGAGTTLVPTQTITMSREYSYDARNTIGDASQVQEIQRSLNDDMVQAILFRLQAAGKHQLAAPAAASSTH